MQSFRTAKHEPGVEGTRYRTRRVENELHPLGQRVVAHYRDSPHHVAMAVEILGSEVIDDVGAVLERPLEIRRSKGVVDDEECILSFRDLPDRREIGDPHHRIGRRFHHDRDRILVARILYVLRITTVYVREAQPEVLEDLVEESVGAAVTALAGHDVV